MTYPNQISAVVRIEKATGAPLIVFGADGCYARIGPHAPRWCANGMRSRAI